jgi:shikimate dehydrogenase
MAEYRAFVCGHPIGHSRSPLIHGHWLTTLGIAGSYERVDVAPSDIRDFIKALPANGYAGGNVTIPHKEAAFHTVDRRDGDADAVGAVNTLWLEDGVICGGNTDAIGFAANLDEHAPEWRDRGAALVLGAGGASRAVVHAILQAGYGRVEIVNRTVGRAQDIADRFGPRVRAHSSDAIDALMPKADLLVNTTSLGMEGDETVVADVAFCPMRRSSPTSSTSRFRRRS